MADDAKAAVPPRAWYWAETRIVLRLALAFALGLLLAAALGAIAYYWAWWTAGAAYLLVVALVAGRHVVGVLRPGLSTHSLDAFLANLMVHNLGASALYRVRERIAVALFILAQAVLWPKLLVMQLVAARWLARLREPPGGRPDPRQAFLVSVPFWINAALFALLPAAVALLTAQGLAQATITAAALALLAANLFCRHLGMLIFPHDPKTIMRQTPADPRALVGVFLVLDTCAFAAVIWAVQARLGAGAPGAGAFLRVVEDLLTAKDFRAVGGALSDAMQAGWSRLPGAAAGLLQGLTAVEWVRLAGSTLLYLNLLQTLFPLRSWARTDDDRKAIAQHFLLAGMPAAAERHLEKVRSYDARTAELEAAARTMSGDFAGAADRAVFAHKAQHLPTDPDLVFLRTLLASVLAARSKSFDFAPGLQYALQAGVGDAVLAMVLIALTSWGYAASDRLLQRLRDSGRADDYPLSRLLLIRACGAELPPEQAEAHRRALEARGAGDPAVRAAVLTFALLGDEEWWQRAVPLGSGGAAEIRVAAEQFLAGLDPRAHPAAQVLAAMEYIGTLRRGLAMHRETTAGIAAQSERILEQLRRDYPALREGVAYHAKLGRLLDRHLQG